MDTPEKGDTSRLFVKLRETENTEMQQYAQTNLQLFSQLHRAGWTESDLARICEAYTFAARLFTGCFRPSGKVFLAHLVGTASILAEMDCAPSTVIAGLLHSAYSHGEFGTGVRGITLPKRALLRRVIGHETEELIAAYTDLRWNEVTVLRLREYPRTLDTNDREAIVIHLANELEDHSDFAALYSGSIEHRRHAINSHLHHCVELADELGFHALAVVLAQVFEETLAGELPRVLKQANEGYEEAHPIFLVGSKSSFLLAPFSHSLRPALWLRQSFNKEIMARMSQLRFTLANSIVFRAQRKAVRHGREVVASLNGRRRR
ncbi:MAG: DUF6817 domain-containing protein [Pyrinomonadaceae bacterium]